MHNTNELDNKTNYTYFWTRYYDSELSVWLSVDPMSDKYPSLSPYCYSADNLVVLVWPNGLAPDNPLGAGHYTVSMNSRYVSFAVRNPIAAGRIRFGVTPGETNISTNSRRFANRGAGMDKLANLVLNEFYTNGLYTATPNDNGNWVVSKTKLSSDKYNQLQSIFKGLNVNVRTASEQNAVNIEAKQNIEQLQLI
ncbi:MAG: RHS repeat-associated core domain-containing protein [Bacteroidales bacterium]|nr:RHS repeat-associated core domain-containing protein [Bacteroidales bacterium]